MSADLDVEHVRRLRAERVADMLDHLWGERPPVSLLVDALGLDDQHGADAQVVVHGDGLTYAALARLLQDAEHAGSDALDVVPWPLAQRVLAEAPTRALGTTQRFGVWEWDPESETVAWDAPAAVILGRAGRAERVAGHVGVDAVHAEDRERVQLALRAAMTTGEPYLVRYRNIGTDGLARPIVSTARALPALGGGLGRLQGFLARDDTAQAQVQV